MLNHFPPTLRLAMLLACLPATAADAETFQATTARGERIDVIADFPSGAGPFPAVVLAPGQRSPMKQPVLEQTAQRLVANGIAVYRFNWAYYVKGPRTAGPSPDYENELEDLHTVLKAARTEKRVDPAKIAVGGKSLGSQLAWRVFVQDKALRGALLLTPVCSSEQDKAVSVAEKNYPDFALERRPVAFVLGDRDPLCAPAVLYAFAAGNAAKTRVAVVGGNHGFDYSNLTAAASQAAAAKSIGAAAQFSVVFLADSLAEQ